MSGSIPCGECSPEQFDNFRTMVWTSGGGTDMVNHPPHYTTGGIETIDFIEAKQLGYHLGNVLKYIVRAAEKGKQLEDLKKARWYLNRRIANLEGIHGQG